MHTRIIPASFTLLGTMAASCGGSRGTESIPDTDPLGDATVARVDTTLPTTAESTPTTGLPAVDTAAPSMGRATPPSTALDANESPAPGDAQASPEAVVEAYSGAVDAVHAEAVFSLIAPRRREGVALADRADCMSDRLADFSGADVDVEHVDTCAEDDATFVEAVSRCPRRVKARSPAMARRSLPSRS